MRSNQGNKLKATRAFLQIVLFGYVAVLSNVSNVLVASDIFLTHVLSCLILELTLRDPSFLLDPCTFASRQYDEDYIDIPDAPKTGGFQKPLCCLKMGTIATHVLSTSP